MADQATIFLSALSIVLSAYAAYLSLYIYRRYAQHVSAGWLNITIVVALLALNRAAIFFSDTDLYPGQNGFLKAIGLASFFLAGIVGIFGLWQVKKTFEEHELVEGETMEKIRKFESKPRARRRGSPVR